MLLHIGHSHAGISTQGTEHLHKSLIDVILISDHSMNVIVSVPTVISREEFKTAFLQQTSFLTFPF
jgi:hypothetical protein